MATAATIKKNIAKLEAALKSKATPKSLKSKLETQLVKSKAELSGINKGAKPKTSTSKSAQTALQKLKEMVNKNKKLKTYKKSGVDLEKDADRPALPIGRRTAKQSGKTYYEYRANRIDVKQPPKRYPKLEQGGYMAKGGEIENQYEGETAESVWGKWTIEQRRHFLLDHSELLDKDRIINNLGYSRAVQRNKTYSELTPLTQSVLKTHIQQGQYAKGGSVKSRLLEQEKVRHSKPHIVVDNEKMVVLKEFKNYNSAQKFVDDYLDANEDKYGSLSIMPKESSYANAYMAKGGMFEKPIPAVMDKFDNIKSEKILKQDLEYLKEAYENKLVTKAEYDKSYDEIKEQLKFLQKKEKGGYMAKGGVLQYESILDVLKQKIDDSIEELPSDYEMAAETFKGEEVERESRPGFIPYTDGGYEARWFDNVSNLNGSGISLPTAGLDAEMQRQVDYNYEVAKDRFKDEYPDIVEELGEDNIEYNALYDAGYESEAEQLSEWEMDYDGDDTIMMEIGAFYYSPENSRGKDNKHTISVFANVNLESPYHRSGNLEDGVDFTFTFNSLEELNKKMDENLKKIVDWFDGKNYKEGKKDLKVTRMAKGGYMAKGGETNYNKKWRAVYITLQGKRGTKEITLGRLSDKDDVRNALRRMSDLNIREVTSIEEIKQKGGYFAKGGLTEHGLEIGDLIKSKEGDYIIVENGGKEYNVHLNSGYRNKSYFKDGGNMGGEMHRTQE